MMTKQINAFLTFAFRLVQHTCLMLHLAKGFPDRLLITDNSLLTLTRIHNPDALILLAHLLASPYAPASLVKQVVDEFTGMDAMQ